MGETDFAQFEPKSESDRTVMLVLYGLHTLAWLSMGGLAVVALIANYIKRADETDAIYVSHHNYMIATFWWTVLWLVVTAPLWLILVLPGILAYTIVGLWYLYRCVRGWMSFANGRPPFSIVRNL
jgi:uncharacterized membrane protein